MMEAGAPGGRGLFFRAAVAVLVLPVAVGFLVPLLVLAPEGRFPPPSPWGWPLVAAGTLLLAVCIREFHVAGRGTLAPWAPPKALVTSGPYRWTRNPMYVAVTAILAGWAVGYGSRSLVLYALAIPVAFHLRIVRYEEPWLTRTFGEVWEAYRTRVPRWW
jgi:protein-S-isoprenylcysteine O-methyltransferase Ste14